MNCKRAREFRPPHNNPYGLTCTPQGAGCYSLWWPIREAPPKRDAFFRLNLPNVVRLGFGSVSGTVQFSPDFSNHFSFASEIQEIKPPLYLIVEIPSGWLWFHFAVFSLLPSNSLSGFSNCLNQAALLTCHRLLKNCHRRCLMWRTMIEIGMFGISRWK